MRELGAILLIAFIFTGLFSDWNYSGFWNKLFIFFLVAMVGVASGRLLDKHEKENK